MNASDVISTMFDNDQFSQWLGIERLEEGAGFCKLKMIVRTEMCNGFGIAHGGITYSFADSALAFASNSQGKHALSIETSITHIKPLYPNDIIIAVAKEKSLTRSFGVYEVSVEKETGELVALFKGTVFRKDKEW
jgi:acyl-CoA thioesterase